MIKKLIDAIIGERSLTDYEGSVYRIFKSEDGKRVLQEFMGVDYANNIDKSAMTPELLAYQEGRRSVIREFLSIQAKVNEKIKQQEAKHDRPNPYDPNSPIGTNTRPFNSTDPSDRY